LVLTLGLSFLDSRAIHSGADEADFAGTRASSTDLTTIGIGIATTIVRSTEVRRWSVLRFLDSGAVHARADEADFAGTRANTTDLTAIGVRIATAITRGTEVRLGSCALSVVLCSLDGRARHTGADEADLAGTSAKATQLDAIGIGIAAAVVRGTEIRRRSCALRE